MNTQADLNHLIDQRLSGEQQVSPIDEESAFLLVAAKMLVQLQEIALPLDFARRPRSALFALVSAIEADTFSSCTRRAACQIHTCHT